MYGGEIIKICPNCGKENRDKSFCTGCGFDITNVETEEERIKREEREQQLELERKEREEREKRLELERKEREEKEKQFKLKWAESEQRRKEEERRIVFQKEQHKFKEKENKKRKSKLKIIGVLIIIIILLSVVLYFQINGDNQIIPDLNSNNQDTVDEIITSQDEEVHYKRVDFNGLFNMYLPEDSNVEEYDPQNNATYEWESGIFFVMYYEQYDDVNQIVSLLMDENPTLSYSTEGNLFIVDNFKVNGVDNMGYVIVQSPDNKFVVISSRGDLETTKTLANSVVFD